MSYTLLGSLRSPFVRIPRIFMATYKIKFHLDVVNYLDVPADRERLAHETPINKIPLLITASGQKIFDSRVMISYLMRTHDIAALSLDEENYVSAIYSALDTSVNLFMLKHGGLDISGDANWYIKRQRERIPSALAFVTPWAKALDPLKPQDWNYASMTLYAYVFWASAREMLDLHTHPELRAFVDRFAHAPGVAETDFTKLA